MVRANSDAKVLIHITPDEGWAWVISIACAAINGITFGLLRSYGVIFVKLLDTHSLTRETASWPFSLCTTFYHLSGPIAGLLLSHYSMRTIVFSGVIVAGIAMMLCFFADSIVEITVYIGVIQGFGIGLSFMQTPVILAQYFIRFRATATAISYAGGTIGSFIFPPIIEYLLNEYGLKGSFLIIGAIMLNALPFALLLRPVTPVQRVHKLFKQFSVISDSRRDRKNALKKDSIVMTYTQPKRNQFHSLIVGHMCTCDQNIQSSGYVYSDAGNSSKEKYNYVTQRMVESRHQLEQSLEALYEKRTFMSEFQCDCNEIYSDQLVTDMAKDKAIQTDPRSNALKRYWLRVYPVISNPLYLVLCLTHVSFQWAWMTYQIIIIDFSADMEFSSSQGVALLSIFSIAELLGRLASGLVADKQWVRKQNIVSICILLIGVLLFLTPAAQTYPILMAMTIVLGFACGAIIVLFSVLTMEYVGLTLLPIGLGTTAFIVGISTLCRPLVVGYFRDALKSYDGLFHFIGLLALLTALLWLLEPFARLTIRRRIKYGNAFRVSVV